LELVLYEALVKHLACVACGQGAWCRDMREGATVRTPSCAYRTHVHAPGECPGPGYMRKLS
jgi:hypothetical protein